MQRSFRLAPMSGLVRGLTYFLFLLAAGMAALASFRPASGVFGPLVVGLFFGVLYAFVWLYMRPTRFELSRVGLDIVWPLRRRRVPAEQLVGAKVVSRAELFAEFGMLFRVGAGGLWGGFGLLWSTKGRHLSLYVSRHGDGLVVVRCSPDRSWLITPERPGAFIEAFSALFDGANEQ